MERTHGDWTRRGFLGLGVACAAALRLPQSLAQASAEAGVRRRQLVLLRLTGGNDGLGTLVPYADERLARLRPDLALRAADVLRLDDEQGLHPALSRLREAYDAGLVACVHGVGQPSANLSHFKSRAIWDAGSEAGAASRDGWLGRFYEATLRGDAQRDGPLALLALGSDALPLALKSPHGSWPAIPRLSGWIAPAQGLEPGPGAGLAPGTPAAQVRECLQRAAQASALVARAAGRRTDVVYPGDALGTALHDVADLVAAELPVSAACVELDGFDTHTRQRLQQARALAALDGALGAFLEDLRALRRLDDVLVLVFSEFGRRPAQSGIGADAGSDHGTAGPVFLVGGAVRAGIHGRQPDLERLDSDGNLAAAHDFRRVYASVLRWLGGDPARVLGPGWEPLELLAS
jgi:uncharacterized protein (DUF1501 family)